MRETSTSSRPVGRFEGEFFDPWAWKPEYPNPAFDSMRPEDAFWAARIVARFSDAAIRAVVAKARYSEGQTVGLDRTPPPDTARTGRGLRH